MTQGNPSDPTATTAGHEPELPLRSDSSTRQWIAALCAMAIFAFLSTAAAVSSKGFLEADACVHYIYARFALEEPHYLTNVWGRPFCTAVYAVPAVLGGRTGVRAMSMLLALATALLCMRIAKTQGARWPALALIFVLAQPLLFLHSFSELTELPFAFLVALVLWAYQKKQWAWMALVASLMPTSRPEGFGFLALALAALILHGRARYIALLFVGLAVWSVAGWIQYGAPAPALLRILLWVPEHWPYSAHSLYEKGPLLLAKPQSDGSWACSFLLRLPAVVSPLVFPAMLVGVWLSFRRLDLGSMLFNWRDDHAHRRRFAVAIALVPLGILAGHSFLWWLGKMASNGELRYLLVAAPFWALLAARGWEWIFQRCQLNSPIGWAGIAALAPAFVNVAWGVVPIHLTPEGERAEQVADWYRHAPHRQEYPKLIATHRMIYYFLDISPSDKVRSAEWKRKVIQSRPGGMMLIWDPIYGLYNSDADLSMKLEEILDAGWVPIHVFQAEDANNRDGMMRTFARKFEKDQLLPWYVLLSPLDKNGDPTPPALAVPVTLPTTRKAE